VVEAVQEDGEDAALLSRPAALLLPSGGAAGQRARLHPWAARGRRRGVSLL